MDICWNCGHCKRDISWGGQCKSEVISNKIDPVSGHRHLLTCEDARETRPTTCEEFFERPVKVVTHCPKPEKVGFWKSLFKKVK